MNAANPPTRAKRTASLSLDLDNLWSYMKTHGEAEWEDYPTYLPDFVPIALEFLERHDQKITFFVVGQDAVREQNHGALRQIAEAGHEFGNHSFNHEPWMQEYDEGRVIEELVETHGELERITGAAPVGFRGPGFCYSDTILKALREMGYQFDASVLPSILGPIARLYYMRGANMTDEERATRRGLFGRFTDGFLPLKPFGWRIPEGDLLEIPVTTIPVFRVPFHLSYVLWLSRYSEVLALAYLRFGLLMCRALGVEPSYLLHPLDLLGAEDAPRLSFFPGMDIPRERKLEIAGNALGMLQHHFDVVPMSEHARRIRERGIRRFATPKPLGG